MTTIPVGMGREAIEIYELGGSITGESVVDAKSGIFEKVFEILGKSGDKSLQKEKKGDEDPD